MGIFENISIRRNAEDSDLEKIRVSFKKIKRYRRGVIPDWYTTENLRDNNYYDKADNSLSQSHLTKGTTRSKHVEKQNTQMSWTRIKVKIHSLKKLHIRI